MTVRHRRIALEPAAAAEALRKGERVVSDVWGALVSGEIQAVRIGRAAPSHSPAGAATSVLDGPPEAQCLLPGSFNPIHEGHRRMLGVAAARLGAGIGDGAGAEAGAKAEAGVGVETEAAARVEAEVEAGAETGAVAAFELAIVNPDKPPLSVEDAAARLARFAGGEAIWLTRAPTFPEKARIFPGATFAVGVDTIVRIAEPRYYGGPEGLAAAISTLGACRFLVFGRLVDGAGGFETLESVALPEALRTLCDGVPEADFRADVSSTELRRSARR